MRGWQEKGGRWACPARWVAGGAGDGVEGSRDEGGSWACSVPARRAAGGARDGVEAGGCRLKVVSSAVVGREVMEWVARRRPAEAAAFFEDYWSDCEGWMGTPERSRLKVGEVKQMVEAGVVGLVREEGGGGSL